MEFLIYCCVLGLIGYAVYRAGKQVGSRKGFWAGRRRERRRRG